MDLSQVITRGVQPAGTRVYVRETMTPIEAATQLRVAWEGTAFAGAHQGLVNCPGDGGTHQIIFRCRRFRQGIQIDFRTPTTLA